MHRAVAVLIILVVLLHCASPEGTVQSYGGPDAFESTARGEGAGDESKSSPAAPRSSDEPSLGPWQFIGNMPEARAGLGAIVSGDFMYVIGGEYSTVIRAHIDASGGLGPWQNMASMSSSKYQFGTAVSGNKLYTLGGYGPLKTPLDQVERTIIQTDGTLEGWQSAGSMSRARPRCSAIALGEYLYVLGGESSTSAPPMDSVERATINSDGSLESWQTMAAMTTARESPAVVAVNGYIYAIGGSGWDAVRGYFSLASVERAQVNPDDGSLGAWQLVTPLSVPRRGLAAVASDNYIYAIGGHGGTSDSSSYNSVERTSVNADGSLGGWQLAEAMTIPRESHAAVTWNGHLYAVGGLNPPENLMSVEGTVPPPATFLPLVFK